MFLLRLLINALALLVVAYVVPGIEVSSFYIALIAAVILGVLNAILRPILLILTLPITVLTLGFFALVINALIFWFVASFLEGFTVRGFTAAFVGAIIMWIVSLVTGLVFKK